MKVAIASDHRGFSLKTDLMTQFYNVEGGVEWVDLGPEVYSPTDDYVVYAIKLVEHMQTNPDTSFGVLICGSGVGMSIVANRFIGIRAGLGFNVDQVKEARSADDINVLALPSDFTSLVHARNVVEMFLVTAYDNLPAHQRRLDELRQLEGGKDG
ncbi:RpiB/LacA/LacB family sugar-phosphate isomerase [candidate division WWE3 bacterium]|uniref:RpiB/LacA/LacB family sugar-phosphate isomerase n=1 Tax=candidate division WWE3 bacterium TaxID=2053526 RepID=A0A955LJP9_UNCKA|nr:RpiB/LacA/LacB family sugar-phosphate isomerase [candidate division WWE3 bacterium]